MLCVRPIREGWSRPLLYNDEVVLLNVLRTTVCCPLERQYLRTSHSSGDSVSSDFNIVLFVLLFCHAELVEDPSRNRVRVTRAVTAMNVSREIISKCSLRKADILAASPTFNDGSSGRSKGENNRTIPPKSNQARLVQMPRPCVVEFHGSCYNGQRAFEMPRACLVEVHYNAARF